MDASAPSSAYHRLSTRKSINPHFIHRHHRRRRHHGGDFVEEEGTNISVTDFVANGNKEM